MPPGRLAFPRLPHAGSLRLLVRLPEAARWWNYAGTRRFRGIRMGWVWHPFTRFPETGILDRRVQPTSDNIIPTSNHPGAPGRRTSVGFSVQTALLPEAQARCNRCSRRSQ